MQGGLDRHGREAVTRIVAEVRRRLRDDGKPFVVAVDGGSGSGKSSVAAAVVAALGAVLVAGDDFFSADITRDGWAKRDAAARAADGIDWRRLRIEALEPLVARQPARWRPFDFAAGEREDGTYGLLTEWTELAPSDVIVLEGTYSARPELADLVDFAVLVDVPAAVRHRRLAQREVEDCLKAWHERWDGAEEHYFSRVRPPGSFELVVTNAPDESRPYLPVLPGGAVSLHELEDVLRGYDLGALRQAGRFDRGTVQTNLLLDTDQGQFVFRVYENRAAAYIQFELELLRRLAETRYPCPAPIPMATGALAGIFNGKPCAMFSAMDGEHDHSPDRLSAVAAIIGRLHRETSSWEVTGESARNSYDQFACLHAAEQNTLSLAQPEAMARLTWLRRHVEEVALPAELPKGICHCDPNPTNFLYRVDRLSAVLDFDMAARAPLVYDLGCLLYWWACPEGRNVLLPRAREVVMAYQSERILNNLEREHLYDGLLMVMLMGAAWAAGSAGFWAETQGSESLRGIGRSGLIDALFSPG